MGDRSAASGATLNGVRELFGWPIRAVAVASPLPAEELALRLSNMTSSRGLSQFLRKESFGRPAPRFRGTVEGRTVAISLFADTTGRNSFAARLFAGIEETDARGSRLTGSLAIRGRKAVLIAWWAFIAVFLAVYDTFSVMGVVTGHSQGWPVLVGAVLLSGFALAFLRVGLLSLRASADRLLAEVVDVANDHSGARLRR